MHNAFKHLVTAGLVTVFLGGCATTEKMDQPTFERLQAQAKKIFEKSESVQNAWTTAEDAFEKAETAAEAGDWETAIKQVKYARLQSELAYRQYESQKSSGPSFD